MRWDYSQKVLKNSEVRHKMTGDISVSSLVIATAVF